jgi:hypothetical protein
VQHQTIEALWPNDVTDAARVHTIFTIKAEQVRVALMRRLHGARPHLRIPWVEHTVEQ